MEGIPRGTRSRSLVLTNSHPRGRRHRREIEMAALLGRPHERTSVPAAPMATRPVATTSKPCSEENDHETTYAADRY